MRVAVTVVVDMTDEQVEAYARAYDLPRNGPGGRVMAKDTVESVRENVLYQLEHSTLPEFAAIGLKR